MSLEEFKAGLSEQYQGEVIGEVAMNCLLKKFHSPREQYLLGTVLQLETETKARLRPVVAHLGIDIIESEESQKMGLALAAAVDNLDWKGSMQLLSQALIPYVGRYQEIADLAPEEYKAIADSMVDHERLIQQLYEREATEPDDQAIDDINRQLLFPLPRPEGMGD